MAQPGLPRGFTYPQNKIEDFVAEAYRGVNMVTLSTFPSAELRDRGQYDPTSSATPPAAFYISAPTESSNNRLSMSGELQPPPTSNNGSRVSAEPPQTSTTNDENASYQANRPNGYSPEDSSFSQTLPSSQQLGVNEGDVDNVRSTGPQYQQQLSQRTSLPQTLPSSQQLGANEGAVDDFGVNFRSTGPPYQQQFRSHPQQFSQGTVNPPFSQTSPPFQQYRVNEGAMDDLGANVRSTSPPYQQQFSQGNYNSSFSQALPPSQQPQVNEDDYGVNVRSAPPYQQQFSQGTTNPSFSQTLPSSRQLGANEGAVDDFGVNTHSTGPPYQQRYSQGSSNSSFSQTLPPSQQIRVNEGTSENFGRNVRPAAPVVAPPYERQFSQGSVNSSFSQTSPPSQQLRFNEGAMDDIGPNVHSPRPHHAQRFSEGNANSSFSQTLPPSQQLRLNEGAVGPNARSTASGSPHSQQFSQGTASARSSSSQTLPPYHQIRANEGAVDNLGHSVRPTASAHPQQGTMPLFSQTLPPSQQIRANEGAAVDNFGPNVRPTAHPQQGTMPLFSQTLPPSQQPRVNEDDFSANVRSTGSPRFQQFSEGTVNSPSSQISSPYQQHREGPLDNFGSNVRSTGPADSSSTVGGRTATFQVQTRPAGSTGGYSLQDPSSGGRPPKSDSSFSASVANALHENFDDLKSETKMSPWVTNQFNDILESPIIAEGTTRRPYIQPASGGSNRSDSPLPVTAPSRNRQSPSGLVNLWTNTLQEDSRSSVRSSLSSQSSEYHGALIAPVYGDSRNGETPPKTAVPFSVPSATTMTTAIALSAQNTNEEDSRYVRFGGVEDIDREIEKRVSLEKEQGVMGTYPIFH